MINMRLAETASDMQSLMFLMKDNEWTSIHDLHRYIIIKN